VAHGGKIHLLTAKTVSGVIEPSPQPSVRTDTIGDCLENRGRSLLLVHVRSEAQRPKPFTLAIVDL